MRSHLTAHPVAILGAIATPITVFVFNILFTHYGANMPINIPPGILGAALVTLVSAAISYSIVGSCWLLGKKQPNT